MKGYAVQSKDWKYVVVEADRLDKGRAMVVDFRLSAFCDFFTKRLCQDVFYVVDL